MSEATDRTHDKTEAAATDRRDDHDDQARDLKPPTESHLILKFTRSGDTGSYVPLPYVPAAKGMPYRPPLDLAFREPWRTF